MSQQELADVLNISQSALCNIENELTDKIPFSLIDKICQIYKVNHSHFSENHQITNKVNFLVTRAMVVHGRTLARIQFVQFKSILFGPIAIVQLFIQPFSIQ